MRDPYIQALLTRYKVIDFAEFVVGTLTAAASVLAIVQFFRVDTQPLVLIAFLALVGTSIVFFLKLLKLREITLNRLRVFSENFHKFTDAIRDEYHGLAQRRREGPLADEEILIRARSVGQKAVDLLANALTLSSGEDVSVCIKYFPADSIAPRAPRSIEDYYLMTLARSANSSSRRTLESKARVGDNTGFMLIIHNQAAVFHASDLIQFGDDSKRAGLGPFRTSNPDWPDLYKSTICVPIRMKSRLTGTSMPDTSYNILGILCADSLSTSAFPKDHLQSYVNLLKAFAAALYIYLDRVYFYLKENGSSAKPRKEA